MGQVLAYGKYKSIQPRHAHGAVSFGKHQAAGSYHAATRSTVASYSGIVLRHALMALGIVVASLLLCLAFSTVQNGVGHATGATESKAASQTQFVNSSSLPTSTASAEDFILETGATRNVQSVLAQVQGEEADRKAAVEQAAREAEEQAIKQAQEAQSRHSASAVGLKNVDFTVGRDAFMEEWTSRINDYLEGSPLEGYGADFAGAAWEYGVDPRWSPAISCTESTKGVYLSGAHNAWGWTGGSWSDWTGAIYAHVAGLAKGYGHTISYTSASRYCPPNTAHWYRTTLSEMAKI